MAAHDPSAKKSRPAKSDTPPTQSESPSAAQESLPDLDLLNAAIGQKGASHLVARTVMQLQRLIGNKAVQRYIYPDGVGAALKKKKVEELLEAQNIDVSRQETTDLINQYVNNPKESLKISELVAKAKELGLVIKKPEKPASKPRAVPAAASKIPAQPVPSAVTRDDPKPQAVPAAVTKQPAKPQPVVPGPQLPPKPAPEPIVETQSRVGFEIEPGGSFFSVHSKVEPIIDSLINETLASNAYLEFIIDDHKDKEHTVQIEFRTKPLSQKELGNMEEVKEVIKTSIGKFPHMAFEFGSDKPIGLLKALGWTIKPAFEQIVKGLQAGGNRVSFPKGATPVQHVTHSIPLAAYVNLDAKYKQLLLPGSEKIRTLGDLLEFFVRKIGFVVAGGTIVVETSGRNKTAPNLKTALDTLLPLLKPDVAKAIITQIKTSGAPVPHSVQIEKDPKKALPSLESIKPATDFPAFPSFNPQGDEGHWANEEKLKAPLFDTVRQDVRVLVEHRADELTKAMSAALLKGDMTALEPYLEALSKLDKVEGDKAFADWIWPKLKEKSI